jgi:peptidyl-tRNA hydrolase, PTH1 family
VGLGNPGRLYEHTRHNIGWMVLEQAADRWGIAFAKQGNTLQGRGKVGVHTVLLVLPLTWMNQVGIVVRPVLQELNLTSQDLIVVHDDLDLPLATVRIKTRGGAGGHNGLRSVLACLGTEEFTRIKMGIGRPLDHEDPAKFVLAPFPAEEWEQVITIIPKTVDILECLIGEGTAVAMNRFHVRSSP